MVSGGESKCESSGEASLGTRSMKIAKGSLRVLNVRESYLVSFFFFFSSRRRHTRCGRDWSSDVCSSDLETREGRQDRRPSLPRPSTGIAHTCRNTCHGYFQSTLKVRTDRIAAAIAFQQLKIGRASCRERV